MAQTRADDFKAYRYERSRMRRFAAWDGKLAPRLGGDGDTPECHPSFEELLTEEPAGDRFYSCDKVNFGISAERECVFRAPSLCDIEHRIHFLGGDMFRIRGRTIARYHVVEDDPFIHVMMPMPGPVHGSEGAPRSTLPP